MILEYKQIQIKYEVIAWMLGEGRGGKEACKIVHPNLVTICIEKDI